MTPIRILYFTMNLSDFTFQNREYFKQTLAGRPDVRVHFEESGGDIGPLLDRLPFTPDFIYIDAFVDRFRKTLTDLNKTTIPKGIMHTDPFRKTSLFKTFVRSNKIDLVFSYYRDGFLNEYPEFAKKFRWLPHHAYTPMFKDYALPKTIDFLLMGSLSPIYPLRNKIARDMRDVPGFVHHEHPGYRLFSKEEQQHLPIKQNYAKEINRARIFLTDGSMYNYPVAKYFEVPACNTLLLASGARELTDLGFIDKQNFVAVTEADFYDKAMHYLHKEDKRIEIALKGHRLVAEHHSTEIRVGQFIDYIRSHLQR
ncbi:glycosyltransferase family 1 protein [Paenibacillus mesophilus]|uniref:glycosyltransferase family protein n=1 Tax=Paenibacillus mesophilus TaxID=2582849 RepID=UPI00110E27DB|nr:glycosyltransferase [Paenibacillus mesophilus]TMV53022.1 glycosyltransferase family 1 protein [Paenibacillus mesophilus]